MYSIGYICIRKCQKISSNLANLDWRYDKCTAFKESGLAIARTKWIRAD